MMAVVMAVVVAVVVVVVTAHWQMSPGAAARVDVLARDHPQALQIAHHDTSIAQINDARRLELMERATDHLTGGADDGRHLLLGHVVMATEVARAALLIQQQTGYPLADMIEREILGQRDDIAGVCGKRLQGGLGDSGVVGE